MTAPLTDDEARRVTKCPDCQHPWSSHRDLVYPGDQRYCWAKGCPCARADDTLAQVAALVAEREAEALEQAAEAIAVLPRMEAYDDGKGGYLWRAYDVLGTAVIVVRGLIPDGGAK